MTPLQVVQAFYEALGRGDAATVLSLMATPLSWTEAQGFPYHSGTWTSPQQVAENLLLPLSRDWEDFSVRPDSYLSESNEVVSFGAYGGINRNTGRAISAPFAHRWRVEQDRIVSFVQYTDTALVRAALE